MSDGAEPRILSLDIETFPNLAYVWGVYEQNALSVKTHSIICCFSVKWLHGKQTTMALPDYRGYRAGRDDDAKLVRELWALLDEADIVVAQNGDKFDIKKMNTRFIKHGLRPPSPYKTVDTLKVAHRIFGFDSNKLNDLCSYLGIGQKFHTGGFSLWQGCMAGDEQAWRKMRLYNAQDVRLLEKLYLRFLPWIGSHPNRSLYTGISACPKCGSTKIQGRGMSRNATTVYQRFQCMACGGWCRATKSDDRTSLTNA